MTEGLYRVVLTDRIGTALAEVPANGLSYGRRLGGLGSCQFGIPIEHPSISGTNRDLLDTWATEVDVYRDSVPVFSGPVTSLEADVDGDAVQVGCQAAPIWLSRREIRNNRIYPTQDQSAIYADLIAYAQSVAFKGINAPARVTVAASATGVSFARSYFAVDRKNILDALDELTNASDGFDTVLVLTVVAGKVRRTLTTAYPSAGQPILTPLRLGESGLQSLTIRRPGEVSTRLLLFGASQGSSQIRAAVNSIATEYRYGRHEAALSVGTATSGDELTRIGQDYARLRTPPVNVLGATYQVCRSTPFRFVDLGDTVPVQADRGWIRVDQPYRVVAEQVTVADDGTHELIALTFNDPVA